MLRVAGFQKTQSKEAATHAVAVTRMPQRHRGTVCPRSQIRTRYVGVNTSIFTVTTQLLRGI